MSRDFNEQQVFFCGRQKIKFCRVIFTSLEVQKNKSALKKIKTILP